VSTPIDEESPPLPGSPGSEHPRPAWYLRHAGLLAATMVALMVIFAVGAIALLHRASPAASPAGTSTEPVRASGIPDTVSTSIAYLMGLSPVPTAAAPLFTLTDQAGRTVSLDSLRGHPVVLEFMDPNCVDICPIVSQEFVDAAKDLGPAGRHVVFLGINVNPFHTDVASMATYSKAHGLDAVATWHFLTGPSSDLAPVWRDYNVAVSAPNPSADVIHTSVVYFIDRSGQERYVAFPMVDHKADGSSYLPVDQTASWGRGIALVARSLN
jgi:protein SCO1/2